MVRTLFTQDADEQRDESLSMKLRRKRFQMFRSLFEPLRASLEGPITILDVGGRPTTWERAGFAQYDANQAQITLLNVEQISSDYEHIHATSGDACNMSQFADNQFHIVFSNSVIEHVGDYDNQRRMAQEVQRVGQRFFIQTPNYYFPIEPHFLFPGFQFLPLGVKIKLIQNFDLGWRAKTPDPAKAKAQAESVQLLSQRKFMALFPGAQLYKEKFFGLTKSFTAYGGWS